RSRATRCPRRWSRSPTTARQCSKSPRPAVASKATPPISTLTSPRAAIWATKPRTARRISCCICGWKPRAASCSTWRAARTTRCSACAAVRRVRARNCRCRARLAARPAAAFSIWTWRAGTTTYRSTATGVTQGRGRWTYMSHRTRCKGRSRAPEPVRNLATSNEKTASSTRALKTSYPRRSSAYLLLVRARVTDFPNLAKSESGESTMQTSRWLSAVGIAALVSANASLALGAPSDGRRALSLSEREALLAGEVVARPMRFETESGSYRGGVSYSLVNAPAAAVLAALSNADTLPQALPHTKSARLIDVRGGLARVELVHGDGTTYTVHIERFAPRSELRFWLDSSRPHDISDVFGFFRVESFANGKSLVTVAAAL